MDAETRARALQLTADEVLGGNRVFADPERAEVFASLLREHAGYIAPSSGLDDPEAIAEWLAEDPVGRLDAARKRVEVTKREHEAAVAELGRLVQPAVTFSSDEPVEPFKPTDDEA